MLSENTVSSTLASVRGDRPVHLIGGGSVMVVSRPISSSTVCFVQDRFMFQFFVCFSCFVNAILLFRSISLI